MRDRWPNFPVPTFLAFALALSAVAGARGGEPTFDFGDAPDDDPVCQAGGISPSSDYPTQTGTVNAAPGRTEPRHSPTATPDLNFYFAAGLEFEAGADEATTCDWLTGPPCDRDDAVLVLCLNAACSTGVFFVPGHPSCEDMGAAAFGITPTPIGYFIYEVTREAASTQAAYINLAVDFGLNGHWGEAGEWIEKDLALPVFPGSTVVLVSPPFPVATLVIPCPPNPLGWCIEPFWSRFLVSEETIAVAFPGDDWDGSGAVAGYTGGETEDLVPATDPGTPTFILPPPGCFESDGSVTLTLDPTDYYCNLGETVNLSSHGVPHGEVRRIAPQTYTTGETVPIELVSLSLTGVGPLIGPVLVGEHRTIFSAGKLDNVVAASGQLVTADSFFDVFFEVDLTNRALETAGPLPFSAGTVSTFPAIGSTYQGPQPYPPIQLVDQQSGIPAGFLCGLQQTLTAALPSCPIFRDGFENGGVQSWSQVQP